MNDFTKEELQMILEDVEHEMSVYRMADNDSNRKFRDKVRRMIDNFCEHKKVVPNYDCKTQCDKCGEIW